ncbi:MAG: fibronectin type III domain-containing protein [Bacteroidota bacterium]|nr:fibronectin type III domain-containing protein [Bacteroidota bacterium]
MSILKIINGFSRMSDPNLETKANQVLISMTGNEYFPAPSPNLTDMGLLIAAFTRALSECQDGDRLKIAIKNQVRQDLIDALHSLATYVLFESAGDKVKALSSGFGIGKTPAPQPPIQKPENFRVEIGSNPGELIPKVNRQRSVLTYIFQYATDEEMALNHWKSIPCSKSSCVISGLAPGTKYNCLVLAVGRKDQLMYSDIISRIAA